MRICAVQFFATIGDIESNLRRIGEWITQAKSIKASVILFPECALPGYLPQDQLFEPEFFKSHQAAMDVIASHSNGIHVLIGGLAPAQTYLYKFFNAYHHFFNGKHAGFTTKTRLPNYDIFNDSRFFEPNPNPGENNIFTIDDITLGVGICEDMWHDSALFEHIHAKHPPHLWICPSASPYHIGKSKSRKAQIRRIIRATNTPFLFLNQVAGYNGVLFDGASYLINTEQKILAQLPAFEETALVFDITPGKEISKTGMRTTHRKSSGELKHHVAKNNKRPRVETLSKALEFGIRNFILGSGIQRAVICVSGGIDSALALIMTKRALGAKSCFALILPSRYNKTQATCDAITLCAEHKVPYRVLSIDPLFSSFSKIALRDFGKHVQPIVFENMQARIRGIIAMTFANQHTACLIGTSNKSELSMGYATLYGDLCAGLLVLGDVYKTQIYSLADYYQSIGEKIPKGTLTRPPSAELAPGQKDTDTLPPYPLLDPAIASYLDHELSLSTETQHSPLWDSVSQGLKKSQFKRKQTAPILKVSPRDLSRGRQVIISGGSPQTLP